MVNIIIYLEQTINAQHLVEELLKKQLFANVTIDKDNVSYKIENGEIITTINTVITAQTKSLLFIQIDNHIKEKYGAHIPIYCIPITHANDSFDSLIRENTKKI